MLSTMLRKKQGEELAMFAGVLSPAIEERDETVFVSNSEEELCWLVDEAGCKGVLDTACSKTVAGLKWMDKYNKMLPTEIANSLKVDKSEKVYQFGGGEKRSSRGSVKLPALIGDKKLTICVELVEAEIPLLIGGNSMEAAEAQLDFKQQTATFFGEEVEMHKVGSGHFCINLLAGDIAEHVNDEVERDRLVEKALVTDKEIDIVKLKKLHHLYGHTSAGKLNKFLVKAGKASEANRRILEEIGQTCEACIKTQRKKPKPKFAIPRAEKPNQIVTLDLKVFDLSDSPRKYICYFIDMFSRLTVASFIPEKKPELIVEVLMEKWASSYGLMKGIHSDIGGEMSNELLEDVAANLGIELTTTAAYSPHQNGLNERNHATVDLMMTKMMVSDPNLTPEMALCWSLNAKNCLENQYGYSPFQLHIGANPKLPSATRDGPPALEGITKSKSLAQHLTAMHLAREAFVEAESSASLRKALKSKIYSKGDGIQEGDLVYYQKNDSKAKSRVWRGPAKVVAVNGKKLFIDQGARLGTVNRDDSVLVEQDFWNVSHLEADDVGSESSRNLDTSSKNEPSSDSEDEDSPSCEVSSTESSDEDDSKTEGEATEGEDNVSEVQLDELPNAEVERLQAPDTDDGTGVSTASAPSETDTFSYRNIRKNDVIKYKFPDTNWETATVMSRAAKATGQFKHWWNVQVEGAGESKSIDTEKCDELLKVDTATDADETIEEALVVVIPRYLHKQAECIKAKEDELENWENFGTYIEVPDEGQSTLNTNWVLTKKVIEGKEGVKARLCVRGDQEKDVDAIRTDSPTVNKTNVKLFYILAAMKDWKIKTADVKAAFLQGASLDRDVFLKPPKERRIPGVIWKMVKRAYGFVDASRGWYLELEQALKGLGCVASHHDPAMYMFHGPDGELEGLVLTHVDDLLHGSGSDLFETEVLGPLKEKFMFGGEEEGRFRYIGMQVSQTNDSIVINQDHYIDTLEVPDFDYTMQELRANDLVGDDSQDEFRAMVGRIGWLASNSRPDLCFDSVALSTKVGKATLVDFRQAIKIMKKAKIEPTEMKFVNLGPVDEWTIEGHGDAGYRSLPDKVSSCGGQVVIIANRRRKMCCVVSWKSKKLKRVVSSSTAAEALALNDTLDELVYIKEVLKEIIGDQVDNVPLELFTDSGNLYKSVMSTSLASNPRIRTDVAKLQQSLKSGEVTRISQIGGHEMIADCLTKKGASSDRLRNILRRGRL